MRTAKTQILIHSTILYDHSFFYLLMKHFLIENISLHLRCEIKSVADAYITKTCLFKYIENFTSKKWKFSD